MDDLQASQAVRDGRDVCHLRIPLPQDLRYSRRIEHVIVCQLLRAGARKGSSRGQPCGTTRHSRRRSNGKVEHVQVFGIQRLNLTRRSWNVSRLTSESFAAASFLQILQRNRDRPE